MYDKGWKPSFDPEEGQNYDQRLDVIYYFGITGSYLANVRNPHYYHYYPLLVSLLSTPARPEL